MQSVTKKNRQAFLWFLLASAMLLMKYSGSSPAFFINTWVDTNANMTVGKSILYGVVPYKDLFEQRGPWLYFINAFCSLFRVSNPFFAVYLYEVICGGVFLFFCWKTLKIFSEECADFFLVSSPLYYWMILREPSFGMGGSPEELCVPALMTSLYLLIRSIHQDRYLSFKGGIIIGLCAGYVFWIKYNMIGFFVGAAIVFFARYAKKSKWKQIWRVLLGVIIGLGIMSLPVFLYFGLNHAISDLFRVYFYDNIFYYSYDKRILYKFYFSLIRILSTIKANPFIWTMTFAGGIYCVASLKERAMFLFFMITGAFHVFFVYQGGQPYPYYGFSFAIYSVMGYLCFKHFVLPANIRKTIGIASMAVTVILACNAITMRMKSDRNSLVQFKFTDEMAPDATLMVYFHIDPGFYNAGNITPTVYYSWVGNIRSDEIREVQDQYIREQKIEYFISVEEMPSNIISDNYQIIDQYDGFFLYKRK